MYGENTKTIAIPIYKVLPYLVILAHMDYCYFKLILMMASCSNEVKFYSCQTVLSMATVSYSCGFSVDSPTIGLTLT